MVNDKIRKRKAKKNKAWVESAKKKNATPARKRRSKADRLWWKRYNTYLKSSKWKAKRKMMFELRGRACEKCRSTKRLQVHHLTYKRVFNELPEDLLIVCHSCHEKIHGRKL